MGLDMYLKARRKCVDVSQQVADFKSHYDGHPYRHDDDDDVVYIPAWSHSHQWQIDIFHDILDAAELRCSWHPPEGEGSRDGPSLEVEGDTVSVRVGDWSNAYAIHAWFVRNVQNDVDECQKSVVTGKHLLELKEECEDALKDPECGFFFGSTEKDEWYTSIIKETIETCDRGLDYLRRGCEIVYQSSGRME